MRERRLDLDRAKGMAILLVVFGHLVAREGPRDVDWYEQLRGPLYDFHMPFFMYLSGYVTFLSGAARTPLSRWPGLLGRRASRLLVPFVLFGLLVLVGKLAVSGILHVDNRPDGVAEGLLGLIWFTNQSPSLSVWYLFVLFVLVVATPPLLAANGGRPWLLLGLAVALHLLPAPPILYADRVARFAVFFVLGGLAADAGARWTRFVDGWWLLLALPFAASLLLFAAGVDPFWRMLAAGLLAMPVLHGLVRNGPLSRSAVLLFVGGYSFAIYLLNTIAIGVTKGVLLRVATWDGANFLWFSAVLMAAGVLGPILAKRLVFRRIPPLDRMTD
jgi:fucose 4-O-acetylase-like acetyltransferase